MYISLFLFCGSLKGYYNPKVGSGVYYACPPGYKSSAGATACTKCPIGYCCVGGIALACVGSAATGAAEYAGMSSHAMSLVLLPALIQSI